MGASCWRDRKRFSRRWALSTACAFLLGAIGVSGAAQTGAADGEWRNYNGDAASTKYAPLDQIDRNNVDRLRIVWRRPAVATAITDANPGLQFSNNFRSTPLMIDGVLYASNGVGLVEAFDPGSGRTIWLQDTGDDPRQSWGDSARGVAYWTDGVDARILAVRGEHLIALNAETGRTYPDFGDAGMVDLAEGLGPPRSPYWWTGVPLVTGDVVIVGRSMSDGPSTMGQPRGDVRAFDVRSGALRWTFHVVPQAGDFGTDTWEDESWRYSGHTNLWAYMSVDEELGYVYLPLSSPTNDMYGGHRLGDNLYGQSLVCVDAETGEHIWHFQTVHHPLWNFDLPAAPILADLTVDGRRRKTAIQVTKNAFLFVFDRVTGEPIWPIEERPVPESTTPGERTAPTQPFPTKPPPFDRQGVSIDDLIDFTPELRAEAERIVERYVIGPMFTPPSIRSDDPNSTLGTIQLPGGQGGGDWQSAAFDPDTGRLYVQSITGPFAADILAGDADSADLRYVRGARRYINGPQGLPLIKPPYGRITAYDMNQGEIEWMVANGEGPRDHLAIAHLNLPRLGLPGRAAPLLTKTLLFVGEGDPVMSHHNWAKRVPDGMPLYAIPTSGGDKFRAYDKETGDILWETALPAGTTGAPITYMHEEKQFIVVAVGGVEHAAEFVALALR